MTTNSPANSGLNSNAERAPLAESSPESSSPESSSPESKNADSFSAPSRPRQNSRDQSGWPAKGLFITGTDTDVGKTFVGAIIVRSLTRKGYRVGVYKPVASGCESVDGELRSSDACALWEAAGRPASLNQVCPQRFAAPLAPNLAAAAEGQAVDTALLRSGLASWQGACDLVVVEGAGGLYSPVSDRDFVIDLAREFAYPLVVVAANRLGTINATLQTLIAARAAGLEVAAIVLSTVQPLPHDPSQSRNAAELARCLDLLGWQIPVLGVAHNGSDQVDRWNGVGLDGQCWENLARLSSTTA